jgi:prepilin-type N-terminal cleavage/methylation domain-containing protein
MIGSKEGIMRSEQQKHGHNKGFTLIELLVSMGIFSIILTIGVGAFVIALNAQRTASAQQAVASNARFALEFMSRQMRVAKEDQAAVCVDGSSEHFSRSLPHQQTT